jgi:hypothetical protein
MQEIVNLFSTFYHYRIKTWKTSQNSNLIPNGSSWSTLCLSNGEDLQRLDYTVQRQALNTLVFLYRDVLDQSISGGIAPVRSKRHPKVPVVMTRDEVQSVTVWGGTETDKNILKPIKQVFAA